MRLTGRAAPVLDEQAGVFQKAPQRKQAVAAVEDSLFERLRLLRRELSRQEQAPPYIIFADSTLQEMSCHRPAVRESPLSIKGVGATKLDRYGAQFLEAIRK